MSRRPMDSTRDSPSRGYFGNLGRGYQTSAFHLTESTYDECCELPLHSHANAHFCLVLAGSYTERLGGREIRREPGDLIFYAAGVDHAEAHHSPGRHFLIEIGPELANGIGGQARAWTSRSGATRTTATRVFAEFRRESKPAVPVVTDLVARLVDEVGRRTASFADPCAWLGEVERKLREAPEGPPDLDRLARDAGVHPVHLGRVFRDTYGCTPGEFLRRVRVGRALRALAADDVGLADVAYSAGFCDQSHLNRVFKRHTGLTPGRYRRLVKTTD